tara:strand:+ start:175 stop:636 length:462 start_codon:yes stop_codon:yes gene_type:complete
MYFYLSILGIFIVFDILIYRILKKNLFIDLIKFSLPLFIIIQIIFFEYNEINTITKIFILINYILFIFAYDLIFTGIRKISPSLFILSQLKKNISSLEKIKKNFFKQKFFISRYKENLNDNLIGLKKNKIYLKKKGINVISVLNLLRYLLKVK